MPLPLLHPTLPCPALPCREERETEVKEAEEKERWRTMSEEERLRWLAVGAACGVGGEGLGGALR